MSVEKGLVRDDGRIVFRELCPDDSEFIYGWIQSPQLRHLTGTQGDITQEGHSKWFANKVSDKSNITMIIEYSGKAVGLIGTNELSHQHNTAEMYLYIGQTENRGRGIGKRAVVEFSELLFKKVGIHKVTARIFSYNELSQKTFEKAGFVVEGIQKEQLLIDGAYCDLIWMGFINRG